MFNLASYFPITEPSLIFLVVLLVILCAPIVMGKLRIPHIVGMVIAGMLLGQYGFNILERDDSFELFGNVGLIYIMFLASLEIDMEGLKKNKGKVLLFGILTFVIPFFLTFFATKIFNASFHVSALLGCIMAANTLIAYPIVIRYGLQKKPSVVLSVGATMIALFFALTTLAAIVASVNQSSNWRFWLLFILKIAVFIVGIVLIIPRLTRCFLRRYSDAVMQFIFVMAMLFLCAVLSSWVGLQSIFGAFLAGLILNRYIPQVSPLMNRIEFIGNAIFIPYFLIGVGMLIDIRLLWQGGTTLIILLCLVIAGTIGKAIAAYLSARFFRLPASSGTMMLGLTSAHAAGAIAIVMVGFLLKTPSGSAVINNEILNAVVLMILFTCIISSILTERSALRITMRDKEHFLDEMGKNDDEKILIPVKYPEYANRLTNLAILMRNKKLNRSLVVINVVYDDHDLPQNQAVGNRLLKQVEEYASSADVRVTKQVRIAANIANGIKHAFKEFQASEILIGMHTHKSVSPKFWGSFHQSLYNGLNRQIMMARLNQPLATIRRIQVAVPSRAQYEPGFYRWLERLARLAGNLDCRMTFHGRTDTLSLIQEFLTNRHREVRAEFQSMEHWNELPHLATTIAEDHLFVVVTARKGTISYKTALERLPDELTNHFNGKNILIVYPDQYGDPIDHLTFARPQHQEERSAYDEIIAWIRKKLKL